MDLTLTSWPKYLIKQIEVSNNTYWFCYKFWCLSCLFWFLISVEEFSMVRSRFAFSKSPIFNIAHELNCVLTPRKISVGNIYISRSTRKRPKMMGLMKGPLQVPPKAAKCWIWFLDIFWVCKTVNFCGFVINYTNMAQKTHFCSLCRLYTDI